MLVGPTDDWPPAGVMTAAQRRWLVRHGKSLLAQVGPTIDPLGVFVGRGRHYLDLFACWTILADEPDQSLGRDIIARLLLEYGRDFMLAVTTRGGYATLAQAFARTALRDYNKWVREGERLGYLEIGRFQRITPPKQPPGSAPHEVASVLSNSTQHNLPQTTLQRRQELVRELSHLAGHCTVSALVRHATWVRPSIVQVGVVAEDVLRAEEMGTVDLLTLGIVGAIADIARGERARQRLFHDARRSVLPGDDEVTFRSGLLSPLRSRLGDIDRALAARAASANSEGVWLSTRPTDVLVAASLKRFDSLLMSSREVLGIGAETGFLALMPTLIETAATLTGLLYGEDFPRRAVASDRAFRDDLGFNQLDWPALYCVDPLEPRIRLRVNDVLTAARNAATSMNGDLAHHGQVLFGATYSQLAGATDTAGYLAAQLGDSRAQRFLANMNKMRAEQAVEELSTLSKWVEAMDQGAPPLDLRDAGEALLSHVPTTWTGSRTGEDGA